MAHATVPNHSDSQGILEIWDLSVLNDKFKASLGMLEADTDSK